MNNTSNKTFQAQEVLYRYPYHHIPYLDGQGLVSRVRILDWGFQYLCNKYNVKKIVEGWAPESVLEVGCGDGAMIGALNPSIPKRVGVDLSERAISFAKAFFPDVDFMAVDAAQLTDCFDVVMAIEVLEHIPDDSVAPFLRVLVEKAKVGGHILITVPTKNIPLNKKHYRHYDEALLRSQLLESAVNVDVECINFFYAPTFVEKLYKRLTNNRFFTGEINFLKSAVWKYVSRKAQDASPSDGVHLYVQLKKR